MKKILAHSKENKEDLHCVVSQSNQDQWFSIGQEHINYLQLWC